LPIITLLKNSISYIRAAAETRCICPPRPQPASPPPCCRAVWLLGLDPADKGRLPTAAIVRIVGVVDGVCAKGVKVPLALATAVLRPGGVEKRPDFAARDVAVAQPIAVLNFVLAIAPSGLTLKFRVCLLDTLHTAVWAEP